MARSYVEEIALRYYQKAGYMVMPNVLFFIPRERTGKKVSGWSDIDILAYRPGELLIIQCKSFLGTRKDEEIVSEIKEWFDEAFDFCRSNEPYSKLLEEAEKAGGVKKVLVVDCAQPKRAIKMLKEAGIEVVLLDELIRRLFELVEEHIKQAKRRGTGAVGKEEDLLLRFVMKLIMMGLTPSC